PATRRQVAVRVATADVARRPPPSAAAADHRPVRRARPWRRHRRRPAPLVGPVGPMAGAPPGVPVGFAAMVQTGDPAPDFELPDEQGHHLRLSDLRGNWVVLWWFPKASTGG